jgi:UDP-glucose 4-epimerase
MRCLITGGAGFIGSHLSELLLRNGNSVSVIDDLSTGKKENIEHFFKDPGFRFTEGSIMNEPLMEKLVCDCDMIYHLAAAVGVKYIVDNPLKSIEINVKGTEIILALASKYKKKIMIASTSEVYGKNPRAVFSENDDSIIGATKVGRWSYACSKALDEFLAFAYHKKEGLPAIIVRLFNTCGPRQTGRYGMVIPRFVKQALSGSPITIYGNGEQTRSFTHVLDVVKDMLLLTENPGAVGEVFNIGNPGGITITDLAKKIKAMTKSLSQITYMSYEEAYGGGFEDMTHRVPDVTKLKKLTGDSPHIPLEKILSDVIDFHKAGKDHF